MRACLIAAACGLLLGSTSAWTPASAQAPYEQRAAAAALRGQEFYEIACADCHGFDGRGNGPMAQFLTVKPTDLTALARRNNGVFPFRAVFESLDGRATVPQHGRPGMPIWGGVFQDFARERFGPHGTESYVRGRLIELVVYLETIQEGN
jgi:mono/diheme cytochrome c family protein